MNRSQPTRLNLERLGERVVPALVTSWDGSENVEWNNADNWFNSQKPGPDDTVVLSGTPTHPPTIKAGDNVVIDYIQMQDTATFDLTINGALYAKKSNIQPTVAHGFVGTGSLRLDNTAADAIDHIWVYGYVKVKEVDVRDGGVLEVRSTFGQLGPDWNAAVSSWTVGAAVGMNETAGTLLLNGDHFVGFDRLYIEEKGEVKYESGGTLTDIPPAPPALWFPFLISNGNKFEIAESQAVALTGGRYNQDAGTSTFRPGSSLSIAGFAGSTGAPDYSFDVLGGKVVAYEKASISSKTDIRIQDAAVDFYSPGDFTRGGGASQVSDLQFTAMDGPLVFKEVLIKNTAIKFLDYAPAGRYTSTTQEGGRLNVAGNAKLDGTTSLFMRVDIGNAQKDTLVGATNTVTMVGTAMSLSIDLRNTANQIAGTATDFIIGLTLDAPANPFGAGISLTGAADGWTKTLTKDQFSFDLTFSKPGGGGGLP